MKHIDDMRNSYADLVHWVVREGKPVAPRGLKTYEVEDAVFRLHRVDDALPVGIGRKPNVAIGAAEALLLCGGIASPGLLVSVAKNFQRFLDGGDLHGGYGRRVEPQLTRAAERLASDRDSRQAVISIWDPLYDQLDSRDVPCTLNFNFRIRDDRLNMSTTMRSNDVWLGACYDVFMFTQLQLTLCNILGVEPGHYTHHAYSLHIYERDLPAVEQLHDYDEEIGLEEIGEYWPQGFGPDYSRFAMTIQERTEDAMSRARAVHNRDPEFLELNDETPSETWYRETLNDYARLSPTENFTR